MKTQIPWYKKSWFITLCFVSIFLIPVGIFLIWKFKKWNNFLKILLSVIGGLFFGLMMVGIFSTSNEVGKPTVDSETSLSAQQNQETSSSEESKPTEEENLESETNDREDVQEDTDEDLASQETTSAETDTKQELTSSEDSNTGSSSSKTTSKSNTSSSKKPNAELSKSRTVYITPTGKKYHYANPCGKGTYSPISLDEAKRRNYEPCGKCVLH